MPVRWEPAQPIRAVRADVRSSGSGGGGSGGGGNASAFLATEQRAREADDQLAWERERFYHTLGVRQTGLDEGMYEIERQESQGHISPETANAYRMELRTRIDPARHRLAMAQARQFELENIQLSPAENQNMLQMQQALARITEQERMGAIAPEQAAAMRNYIAPRLQQYGLRRTRAGALQQQMEAGLMQQQAEQRIIQRRNPQTGQIEDWVIDRNGVPQPPRQQSTLADTAQAYDRIAQTLRTRTISGTEEPAGHEQVAERMRQVQELHRELAGGASSGGRQGPRIVEGGVERRADSTLRSAPPGPESADQRTAREFVEQQGRRFASVDRLVVGDASRAQVARGRELLQAATGGRTLSQAEQQEYGRIAQDLRPLTEPAVVEGEINPAARPVPSSPHLQGWLRRIEQAYTRNGALQTQAGADAQAAAYLIRTHGPREQMPERVRSALDIALRRLGVIARHDDEQELRPAQAEPALNIPGGPPGGFRGGAATPF